MAEGGGVVFQKCFGGCSRPIVLWRLISVRMWKSLWLSGAGWWTKSRGKSHGKTCYEAKSFLATLLLVNHSFFFQILLCLYTAGCKISFDSRVSLASYLLRKRVHAFQTTNSSCDRDERGRGKSYLISNYLNLPQSRSRHPLLSALTRTLTPSPLTTDLCRTLTNLTSRFTPCRHICLYSNQFSRPIFHLK